MQQGQIRKLKDEAAELLRRGKHEKALALYRKAAELDPTDFNARRNLGSLLRKLGRTAEAAEVFVALANEYTEGGFLLKAIATLKVVLELDPAHKAVQTRLAELYASRSADDAEPRVEVRVMAQGVPESSRTAGASTPDTAAGFEVRHTTPLEHLMDDDSAAPVPIETLDILPLEPVDLGAAVDEPAQSPAVEEPAPVMPEYGLVDLATAPAAKPQAEPDVESLPEVTPEPLPVIEPEPLPVIEPEPVSVVEPELPPVAEPEPPPVAEPEPPPVAVPEPEPAPVQAGAPAVMHQVVLPEIPLFSDLAPEAFVQLLEHMKLRLAEPGEVILREGESGDSMFTIASGQVRVLKKLEGKKMLQLAVLGEGAFFGEMSVLAGGPRGATVQATESTELFEIARGLLDEIASQYPEVEQVLRKFARQRLLRNVMVTSPLFEPFTREQRIEIIERFVSRDVEPDQVLVQEGLESDGLYMVLRGQLEVYCRLADGSQQLVGELLEGEVFGEISCLRKEPAIATVKARFPGSVLRLPRADFDSLVLSHPQILELVARLGDERIAQTANALARRGILI